MVPLTKRTRYSLELAPSALSILLAQSGTVTDATAGSNCFNARHLSNALEVHADTCYQKADADTHRGPHTRFQVWLEAGVRYKRTL